MYTFEDGGGRSLTLRPEGTAPICRAYVEHGMHKLPQPAKLWYLSSFFRYERAQAGRYRQFWQIGAEAIGSDDPAVDAELITLLATLLDAVEVSGVRLRLASLGSPQGRAAYREQLQAYLRAHADQLSDEVRGRIDLNPLRAFDADHPGTRAVMERAPRLLDSLVRRRRRALRRGPRDARRGGRGLRDRPVARPRAGLLHAHGLRVHLRRAGRPVRRRRRGTLRRPRRAARRPADPRLRLGGRRRAHPPRGGRAADRAAARRPVRRARVDPTRAWPPSA